jgi:arylsulfatase A-like enzyme
METFAGFAEHTDEQVGRLVVALQEMGVLDNTLFIYIVGDNGASAEGGPEGAYNEMMALNGIINTAEINMPHLENWGDPTTFPHYAIGWAWAGDTPFQWTKQIASHYGGTTNGVVIHWPARVKAKGEVRSQFTHVTDIAPTVLEAVGLPFPKNVNGTAQKPFDGTSMVYTFDDPKARETHTTQYFEMFGNRGIYHDGGSVHAPFDSLVDGAASLPRLARSVDGCSTRRMERSIMSTITLESNGPISAVNRLCRRANTRSNMSS